MSAPMFNVKMLGTKEMQAEVARVSRDLMEAEQPSAMAAGEPILEKWRAKVPILDGNYRDSLVLTWLGAQGAAVGISWVPSLDRKDQPVMYAKRLEFGDSVITAQPAARPALAEARAEALAAGAEPMRSVVRGRRPRRKI